LNSFIIFISISFIDSLENLISEGAFGYVCNASNLKSDEKIAIKFYKKQENNNNMIEQEIKVGFDKRLICPYIMTFQNDFTFSNEETGGEFRCVSMELMNCSLELLIKNLNNKESSFLNDTQVLFILFTYFFCFRPFCTFSHRFYLVLVYSTLMI
jgi:serine/threonine protein kinase